MFGKFKYKLNDYFDDQRLSDGQKKLLAERLKLLSGEEQEDQEEQNITPLISTPDDNERREADTVSSANGAGDTWVRRSGLWLAGGIAAAFILVIGIGALINRARGDIPVIPPADSVPQVSQSLPQVSQPESSSSESSSVSTEKPHKKGQLDLLLEGYVVDNFDPTYGNGNTFFVDEAEDITVTAEFDAQGEDIKEAQYLLFVNSVGRQVFAGFQQLTPKDDNGMYSASATLTPDMYMVIPDLVCPPMSITAFALVRYADGETMLYCDTLYNTAFAESDLEQYYGYVEEYIDNCTADLQNMKWYIPADDYFSSIKWTDNADSIENYLAVDQQSGENTLIDFYSVTGAAYNIFIIADPGATASEPFYSTIVAGGDTSQMLNYSTDIPIGDTVYAAAVPIYDFDLPVVIADSSYPENIMYIGDDTVSEYETDR